MSVLCATLSSSFPRCCSLMPGRSRTVGSSPRVLGLWVGGSGRCELGGGVHPFVSDEKIKDRLGVG